MRTSTMGVRRGLAVAVLAIAGSFATALAADIDKAVVTADWLQKNLNNPKVRIIEVSVDPGVYERGHIPGAVNVSWHDDLVDKTKRDIASRESFEKLVQKAGIEKDSTIVLYGDNNNWFAAWGGWVFDVYGLGQQVRLLDGGRKLWEAKGLPLSTSAETVKPSTITISAANPKLRAHLADVVAASTGKTDAKLVDIRSADEYSGKIFAPEGSKELSIRAGHVPGAVNVPWVKAVNQDGTLKSVDELRKIYADVGIDGKKPIITYCRIGERSSHTWYVLSRVLGYDVRNYDGSWTEYGNAVGVAVSNPSGTVWRGK